MQVTNLSKLQQEPPAAPAEKSAPPPTGALMSNNLSFRFFALSVGASAWPGSYAKDSAVLEAVPGRGTTGDLALGKSMHTLAHALCTRAHAVYSVWPL